jgi:hypothetical protein
MGAVETITKTKWTGWWNWVRTVEKAKLEKARGLEGVWILVRAASMKVCSTSSRRGTSASEYMNKEDDKVEVE